MLAEIDVASVISAHRVAGKSRYDLEQARRSRIRRNDSFRVDNEHFNVGYSYFVASE